MATESRHKINGLQEFSQICAKAIAPVERIGAIPSQMLLAIALTESGRWDKDRRVRFAWPWTVTSGGSGKFFDTRQQAIDHVKALQAKGVRNIDVGCMQVNLKYHPKAFANLEQAFNPHVNVAYAAEFLQRLRVTTLSWAQAVRHYHSSHRVQGRKYWRKFQNIWFREARRAAEKTRHEKVAFLRKRQMARLSAKRYGNCCRQPNSTSFHSGIKSCNRVNDSLTSAAHKRHFQPVWFCCVWSG